MTQRILIVLTSHHSLGDTGKNTGFHYEEFTTPYYAFKDAGIEVDIASVLGGQPPHDPSSLPEDTAKWAQSVTRFRADTPAKKQLAESYALHEINRDRYDGIYIAGGHGTMWDLPNSKALADILVGMFKSGKIISSVCHGAAGLVSARLPENNESIVKGKKINSFSNEEETEMELEEVVPFMLETQLRELGADYHHGKAFEGFTVRDGQFITGQNPQSLAALSKAIISALQENAAKAA